MVSISFPFCFLLLDRSAYVYSWRNELPFLIADLWQRDSQSMERKETKKTFVRMYVCWLMAQDASKNCRQKLAVFARSFKS